MLFTNAAAMLNELAAQDGDNALRRRLALYARPKLLVIDEIGYLSYSNRHADLLFEIVSRRYEEKSTLITTNKPFAEWNQVFPNASCVVSLVDRLVHHAEIIPIECESYRLKEAKERTEEDDRQTFGLLPAPLIPDDWSPEQALAVYEFLDELRDRVWDLYHEPIIEQLKAERRIQQQNDNQLELPLYPFNDEIPF